MLEKWLTCALGDSPWELHCPGRVTFRLTELINAVLLPRPLVPACPAGSEAETGPGVLGAKLPPEAPGSAPSCRPCPQRAQQPKAAGRRGQGTLRAFPPSGNHLPNLLTVNRCPAVKVSGSLKWGGGSGMHLKGEHRGGPSSQGFQGLLVAPAARALLTGDALFSAS